MGKTYLFLFFLIVITSCFSQSQKPPLFVTKVYDDLYRNLYVTKKIDQPEIIQITTDINLVVDYLPASNGNNAKIRVGSEFIKVLRSFGADSCNALAFVLGHEMAHIFLEQSIIDRVGSGYADKELRKKLKDVKDSAYTTIFERQADEYAIFYSHLGGYKTTHLAENVLDKIYTHFKLPSKLRGYPTLQERKQIARFSVTKIGKLIERFDIANLCFLARKYLIASSIYEAIINEGFKSSEMYNNLGLCYMMQVIESDTLYQKYEWPIFLDSKTKLVGEQQRAFGEVGTTDLLNLAIKNFEVAKSNSEYKMAYLNLSIAHLLFCISNEDKENDHLLDSKYALAKLKAFNLPQSITLSGIIEHFEGNLENSKKLFLSNSEFYYLSKRNLDRLFYNVFQVSEDQNPLSKILKYDKKIVDVFIVSKVLPDTCRINSFENTTLRKVNSENAKFIEYKNKAFSNNNKVFIAQFNNQYDDVTENQLMSFADRIYNCNSNSYYVYNEWIIQYDYHKSKKVYLIQ